MAKRNLGSGAAFIVGGAISGGAVEAVVGGTVSAIATAALIGAAVGVAFWLSSDDRG